MKAVFEELKVKSIFFANSSVCNLFASCSNNGLVIEFND